MRTIGIIGGLGPAAGLLLVEQILESDGATRDQEHVPVIMTSLTYTPDRTSFILGLSKEDPWPSLEKALSLLSGAGVYCIGVACFTAHFWWEQFQKAGNTHDIVMVSAVDAILSEAAKDCSVDRKLLILGTKGSRSGKVFGSGGIVEYPDDDLQEKVQAIIYDPDWGLKATGRNPSSQAVLRLRELILNLPRSYGAVALCCTELSLACDSLKIDEVTIIDGTRCLARALVHCIGSS